MSFRASFLSIILVLAPALTSGFVSPSVTITSRRSTVSNSSLSASSSRRNFLDETIASTAALIVSTSALPLPAVAKEAPVITKQTVTEAFDAIRFELNDPSGVVASLANLIENGSFEEILEYTKESDAYFRKAKLGKARKLLTDKDLKGDAVLMSNAVTFDLIGINRASRPGKESKEDQMRYLGELKKDIEKFLELESTIVFDE